MRVLVACECSGVVREAFRRNGHEAWSCDVVPSDDSSPWHIQDDVLNHLKDDWDLMIAHPPCTALAVTGNRHYANTTARIAAALFVKILWEAPIERICIENPVGVLNTLIPELPNPQYVQPWMWGDPVQKKTGLWLKNLPSLTPKCLKEPSIEYVSFKGGARHNKWYYETSLLPQKERAKVRSKTFKGIADAMASQWGTI